ncbi:MAG: amidohydrolase family protein [Candidatus Hadarchaeum sp.]|uniref:amidohydrolase family protein n=1 Tax=Candidatus Hadarchaeum sp. TaxID=2883567 RepID=UPI003D1371B5
MVDILVRGGILVTMDPNRRVIKQGSVAIDGDRIVAVGEEIGEKADKVIDARGKAILPGLINGHTHLAMALLRGYADDMPLDKWLSEKIWPMEKMMRPRDCYVGSLLGSLEMIKSGTTCFADNYFHMDQVARAVKKAGLRGVLSYGMIDRGNRQKMKEEIRIGRSFVKSFQGKAQGRILTMFGPHAPYTCSTECLLKVKELAKRFGVGIHIHVAESREEVKLTVENYGKRPVEYLDSIGFLGPEVLAAHCVWLTEKEIEMLRTKEVKPVHNPASNLKMGSGIAPVPEMLSAGIPVALGTDGAASNNSLDMFKEMKLAALLGKVRKLDPTTMPAMKALEMATINGATALGLSNEIGSVEVGKRADLITVDLKRSHLTPMYDVVSHLVYSANGGDVDTVIVDGKILMEGGKVLTLDEEKVLELAQRTSDDLVSRAGGNK